MPFVAHVAAQAGRDGTIEMSWSIKGRDERRRSLAPSIFIQPRRNEVGNALVAQRASQHEPQR
jgi:hypothetical protein